MEAFIGSWKLESSDNFDAIMKELGINAVKRAAGNTVKPTHIFEDLDDGKYCYKTQSSFKNTQCIFKLGEEFDEETSDGRHLKSTITIDSGVMKQVQTGEGHTTYVDRSIEGDLMKTVSDGLGTI